MNKISIPTNGLKYLDDMTEKNLAEITIHDVDPLALTLLVNFSYTGELSVCEDNVQVKLVSTTLGPAAGLGKNRTMRNLSGVSSKED